MSVHFKFGSQTRDTNLPRAMDEHSDVDYMIVFKDGGYTPRTYLDRLKRFVGKYYPPSSVKQTDPTVTLELNHIMFDLVPALKGPWTGTYKIPSGTSAWRDTSPKDFKTSLTIKDKAESYNIKPTVRLAKIWNANAGYVYESFGLEKWVVEQSYYLISNQRDYIFRVFDAMSVPTDAEWREDRVRQAKDTVVKVRQHEKDEMPDIAESEVKKLIPE